MVQIISTSFVSDYLDRDDLADGVSFDDKAYYTKGYSTRKSSPRPRASVDNKKPELVARVRTTRKRAETQTQTTTKPQVAARVVRVKAKRKSS